MSHYHLQRSYQEPIITAKSTLLNTAKITNTLIHIFVVDNQTCKKINSISISKDILKSNDLPFSNEWSKFLYGKRCSLIKTLFQLKMQKNEIN